MKYYKVSFQENVGEHECAVRATYDSPYGDCSYIEWYEGYVGPEWVEVTEEDIRAVFGYNPFTEEDPNQPEPEAPDPTITQLTQIIVETSVNVDYLVSMQSFQ